MTNNNKIPPPRMWANGKYLPVVSVNYETQQATAIDGEDRYCYPLKDVEWPTLWPDKNGKMVYYGDFIAMETLVGFEVVKEAGRFCLRRHGTIYNFVLSDFKHAEIIGNVRENPELAARVRGEK